MSTIAPQVAARRTGRSYAGGAPSSPRVAVKVVIALWCRSVGTSWTLELYEPDGAMAPGIIKDWITSGVPISQPAPEALARELLAERGLELFPDSSAGTCTHNRHRIGYASTNAELIRLAHLAREDATETGTHPVLLATQWITTGFSPDTATSRTREGTHSPHIK